MAWPAATRSARLYENEGIAGEWLDELALRSRIVEFADRLLAAAEKPGKLD